MARNIRNSVSLPTNYIFDVSQLYEVDVKSAEFKELLVRLYQNVNAMNMAINAKESSYYDLNEFINNQFFFPNPQYNSGVTNTLKPNYRSVIRKVFNFPQVAGVALGPGTTTIAHNIAISSGTSFTRIYGTASDRTSNNYYPLPWASAAGLTNIELLVNATDISVTNNSGIVFDVCYVILEFLTN